MAAQTPSLTVRLPGDLHRAVSAAAARSHCSLNALVRQALEAYLQQEADERLRDSFSRLGDALEEGEVEFAWDAQREAIERVSG